MIQLEVKRQKEYSKLQLILRLIFGVFYIMIPHFMALFFVAFISKIVWVYVTFMLLLTGVYPPKSKQFLVGILKWVSRLHLTAYNLRDDYPRFGLKTEVSYLKIETEQCNPNRLLVLIRFLFAGIIIIPHLFIWFFVNICSVVLTFLAFWVVLFTGKYPEKWFDFNIGTLRWLIRVLCYQLYLNDDYPPFSGRC